MGRATLQAWRPSGKIAPTKRSKLPRCTRATDAETQKENVTHKVLRADVGAVEGEGRDRLEVPGRRGQVEGGAAVLGKRRGGGRLKVEIEARQAGIFCCYKGSKFQ